MKKQSSITEEAELLRQKAEELLHRRDKARYITANSSSEADLLKLIHELEVHQVELEMQNEELVIAKEKAELAEEKYTELYDFAPSCYITLSKKGEILELNFAAAKMLGKERTKLIKKQFVFFVSIGTQKTFNLFFQDVFTSKVKQTCEVIIATEGNMPNYVNIDGIVSQNNELCLLTLIDITERKSAERNLLEEKEHVEVSENKFRTLTENSPAIIYRILLKPSFKFEYVSPAVTEITGYTPEDHYADPDLGFKLVHPDDRIILENSKHKTQGEPVILRWVKKDGKIIWTEQRNVLIFDTAGNPFAIDGIATDITVQKEAEEALRMSEELLGASQRLSKTGGWDWNVETQTMYWTEETYRIHDISPGEIEPGSAEHIKLSTECYSPQDRPVILAAFQRCQEEGQPYDLEFPFTSVKRRQLWIRTIAEPVIENGKTIRIIGNIIDITAHKLDEEALRKSEHKVDIAREAILDSFLIFKAERDEQGNISDFIFTYINGNAEKMLQLTSKQLIGKRMCEELPINRTNGFFEKYRKVMETGIPLEEEFYLPETHVPAAWYYHQVVRSDDGIVISHRDITERKQAEEALRMSEERFLLAMKASHDGLFDWNLETNEIYYSPGWKKMLGYTDDELPNDFSVWEKTTEPEDVKKSWELQQKLITKQTDRFVMEFKMKHKDGHWVDILSRAEAVFNESGKAVRIVGTHTNISETKQAVLIAIKERAISDSIIESIPGAFYMLDENGRYVRWNAYQRDVIVGKPDSMIPDTNAIDTIHPDDRQSVGSRISNVLRDGIAETVEGRVLLHGGPEYKWMLMTGRRVVIEEKPYLLGIGMDITERKLAEEKLMKSEERYALGLEASEQGIWDWNVETNEVFYSEQWKKQIGYNDDELNSEFNTWVEHLHPDEKEYCQNAVLSYLNKPVEHFVMDFRFRHKDGTYRWIHNKAASIKDKEGKVIRLFGTHTDITDSKLNEAIFKDIIEKNPMSIQILDMEGYPLQVNPAHTKLFGVEPPSNYSIFKDSQLLALGFVKFFERIKKGEVVYFPDSYYNVHDVDPSFPDSPVWIKALGFTLNDISGNPNKIVIMHENITERKNAEALLNDIIENNPMSIQIVDNEGYTHRGNPAFIELFGSIPPPEFSIFEDLKSKSTELGNLVSMVKNGEMVHLPDIYFNAHDAVSEAPSNPLWIRALIFPLKDSRGKPERFVFMHENITDRKFAEQELLKAKEHAEESEKKFREMAELLPQIVFETDIDGKLTYINKYAYKLTGYSEQDSIIGKSTLDFYIPEDRERAVQNIKMRFTGGKLIESNEYTMIRKDGSTFNILVYSNPIFKDSKPVGLRGIIVDISELKQTEQELINAKLHAEESDRLKSAFLANMSHEIRTPMNGILGFSELLKEPGLTGEQQQEYIRIIEKSGVRMLNIINDIVDISKIEAGLMKLDISESNVNEQIEYIYTFFRPEVEAKGMKLSFRNSLTAKEAIIKTDREKLYAILTNLVKNAIKYTLKGSIELGYNLKTKSGTHVLEFYIKDSGIGIAKDRHKAIFERFIQAEIADRMARQGAGLGLSISKAYVEMLGGKIWVESEKGIGSTFYFNLPYNAEPVKDTIDGQTESSGKNKTVRTLKILIAEDDEVSEMLIDSYIKMFGKEILKARTGVEVLEACRNNPDIDLILMDIRMPEMGGYEATKQIRQFNKSVIILAQTAFGLSGDREKAIEAGCNDYISKPIKKEELQEMIQRHFGK